MKNVNDARGRTGRKTARVVLDVAMGLTLLAIMTTALVQEAPHEWLGIALFVFLGVHIAWNRRWLTSVFQGRHNTLRVLQIVVIVGLAACILGQLASSLVLSKHAFGFLPAFPGASWVRTVHMLCSYWAFVFAFAHVGLHARVPKSLASWQTWAIRIVCVVVASFGVFSFVQLGLWPYLTGQVQFAFVDFSTPLPLTFARFASVAVLVALVFHGVREGLLATVRRR